MSEVVKFFKDRYDPEESGAYNSIFYMLDFDNYSSVNAMPYTDDNVDEVLTKIFDHDNFTSFAPIYDIDFEMMEE